MTDRAVFSVSPTGDAVVPFVTDFAWPIGATMVPPEFAAFSDDRLFVADATSAEIKAVDSDGGVDLFTTLPETAIIGLSYIPQDHDGIMAGQLMATMHSFGWPRGDVLTVHPDGAWQSILGGVAAPLWTSSLAPESFGELADRIVISHAMAGNVYVLDEVESELDLFAVVPMQELGRGLRQMTFSPPGWAEHFDSELADESVLLVSVASHLYFPPSADTDGRIDVWDLRGRRVASLTSGHEGQNIEPRGLLFVGDDLLFSDITEEHGWLIRVTVDDFGLPDCDGDGVLDECEIAAGSPDCNENGVPDECEVDCNDNGIPDQCDLIGGTAPDCDGNFILDSCDFDLDGDGTNDGCDDDIDGDGYANDVDVCDYTPPGTPIGSSGEPFGDWDLDCDVELDDYAIFEICLSLSGPDEAPPFTECLSSFDADLDGDIDLKDFMSFQVAFDEEG